MPLARHLPHLACRSPEVGADVTPSCGRACWNTGRPVNSAPRGSWPCDPAGACQQRCASSASDANMRGHAQPRSPHSGIPAQGLSRALPARLSPLPKLALHDHLDTPRNPATIWRLTASGTLTCDNLANPLSKPAYQVNFLLDKPKAWPCNYAARLLRPELVTAW